ncbi:hypothetical protein RhiLY_11456 [Ceratobasidium sp. AG-Ba]|nr:hypothetical protein RhiLY_11456 [Ceratobasidium sp. AG-Ba]
MAPVRNNKSAKATSVRYDPRDARVVSSHTPKSVWGKQRVSHKLTWGHGGDRLYSYQDAIRQCDSFIQSSDFAKSLDPNLTLDYIPMAERWNCHKLFVIEEWVGNEVEHLVKEVQKVKKMMLTPHLIRRLEEWEKEGKAKEKAMPKTEEGWMMSLGDKGGPEGNILREVVELAEKERWSKRELLDWLDQRAWDKGNEDLSVDMADLLLEPLDEDEEWVKLKEEVWGAEAPNGAKVYHPKDTEEF